MYFNRLPVQVIPEPILNFHNKILHPRFNFDKKELQYIFIFL